VQQQWRILLQLQHLRHLLVHVWLLDEEVDPSSLGQEPGAASQRQFLEIGTTILPILKNYRAKMVCRRNLAEYYLADITLSKFGGLRLTANFFRRIYGGGKKFGGYGEWRRLGGLSPSLNNRRCHENHFVHHSLGGLRDVSFYVSTCYDHPVLSYYNFYLDTLCYVVTLTFDLFTLESCHMMPFGWSIRVSSSNWIWFTVPELGRLQFSIDRQLKS